MRTVTGPSDRVVIEDAFYPEGKSNYYALFPVPNQDSGIDWRRIGPRYRDLMLRTLQANGCCGGENIVFTG